MLWTSQTYACTTVRENPYCSLRPLLVFWQWLLLAVFLSLKKVCRYHAWCHMLHELLSGCYWLWIYCCVVNIPLRSCFGCHNFYMFGPCWTFCWAFRLVVLITATANACLWFSRRWFVWGRILLKLVDRLMSGKDSFDWMLVLKMRLVLNCSFSRLGMLHNVG